MDAREVEGIIARWLNAAAEDPNSGHLPIPFDGTVRARYITRIGRIGPGQAPPDHGLEAYVADLRLYFVGATEDPQIGDDTYVAIEQLTELLNTSIKQDAALGTGSLVSASWSGSTPIETWPIDAPPGARWAVTVHLSVRHWNLPGS